MKNIRILSCTVILLFTFSLSSWGIDKSKNLKVLADSASHLLGKSEFIRINEARMKLARELKDTAQIDIGYNDIFSHYYQLGEVDSLRAVCYEMLDWYAKRNRIIERYQTWRQYIQRLTENGKQDEAIAETNLLNKDAQKNNNSYGQACSEMCIGYNHRVFSNNVKLCIEYYNNALKTFEDAGYYEDAYIVSLNIVQTYLSRQEYPNVQQYLRRMEKIADKMKAKGVSLGESLCMRYLQFKVIAALAEKGKAAAKEYVLEADRYYMEHPGAVTKDSWYGYKIMCYRTLNDLNETLVYLDSLNNYHKSIGACYPANLLLKAQYLETAGRLKEACMEYAYYAHVNDSVRSAEIDDKLSKYTVQFDVNKLKMEKLELSAAATRNRLIAVLTGGVCILVLLIILTYFYLRTLAMNKKLDAAHKAVVKASRIKSSFIQHITHEIRTPLNSIVGFSSLLATGGTSEEENQEYVKQIETSNAYLLDLVNNVVDIADMDSRTEDMPKRQVNVDECCRECITEIIPSLKENIDLQYVALPHPVTLLAVAPWVKRVLLALLNNAAKFTNSGFIRLHYEYDKQHRLVRFIVEDSGPGISEEYKESIFERFSKVDSFTPGTGLGLAVVHQIMEIVDGKVYLDTSYAGGARFVVEWPAE